MPANFLTGRADNVCFGKPDTAIANWIDDIHDSLWNNGNATDVDSLSGSDISNWGVNGAWPMDEASGTRLDYSGNGNDLDDFGFANQQLFYAADVSGNANNLTFEPASTTDYTYYVADAPAGSGYIFSWQGANGRDMFRDNITGLRSVSFYFKYATWGSATDRMYSLGSGNEHSVYMNGTSGVAQIYWWYNGASVWSSATGAFGLNQWYLLQIDLQADGSWEVFLDGQSQGTGTVTISDVTDTLTVSALTFGSQYNFAARLSSFTGTDSSGVLLDVPLNDPARDLALGGPSSANGTPTQTAIDVSGNDHHGTLVPQTDQRDQRWVRDTPTLLGLPWAWQGLLNVDTDTHIDVGTIDSLQSVSIWFKLREWGTGTTQFQRLWGNQGNNNSAFVNSAGAASSTFIQQFYNAVNIFNTATNLLALDTWYFYEFELADNGNWEVRLDNTILGSGTVTVVAANTTTYIGGIPGTATQDFEGSLSDCWFYGPTGAVIGHWPLADGPSGNAPSDGQPVTRWLEDGFNDSVQWAALSQPIFRADAGGYQALEFDGVDDAMVSLTNLDLSTASTIYVVCQPLFASGNSVIVEQSVDALSNPGVGMYYAGTGSQYTITGSATSTIQTVGFWEQLARELATGFDGGAGLDQEMYRNGVSGTAGTAPAGTRGNDLIFMGARDQFSMPANIQIFEVFIYDYALTDAERFAVATFLMNRYGL